MTENRKKYVSTSLIQRYGSSECLGASSRHTSGRRESLDHAVQFEAAQHIHQTAWTNGGVEDHPTFSSAKRAHAIHPPVPQILSHLHVEMEMMPVPEDAMEAQPDIEMVAESVRRGTKRTSSTWEDCADKINMEVCLDTVGDCSSGDSCRSQIRTHTDTRARSVQVASQIQKVIHEDSHQHEKVPQSQERQSPAKKCDTRVRADVMRVSEHYASTLCTRKQRLMINRRCQSVVHVNQSHAIRYPRSFMTGSREVCGQNLRQISD